MNAAREHHVETSDIKEGCDGESGRQQWMNKTPSHEETCALLLPEAVDFQSAEKSQ